MTGGSRAGERAPGAEAGDSPPVVDDPVASFPPEAPTSPGLTRFYAFQTLAEFSFTGGIWILYLRHRGFSLAEIGLAESVFHLAPITLELPSGSFADVLGRKWSLVAGALLIALSAGLMLRVDSLWILLPAMYLNGAAYAFRSGATQAFLYDSLAAGEESGRFTGLWGRLLSASYVVFAATTWLGAALAERDLALRADGRLRAGSRLAGGGAARAGAPARRPPGDGPHRPRRARHRPGAAGSGPAPRLRRAVFHALDPRRPLRPGGAGRAGTAPVPDRAGHRRHLPLHRRRLMVRRPPRPPLGVLGLDAAGDAGDRRRRAGDG
ncbi:MAG: hypothetical protein AVDCRST_MAG59-2224 [uncultured Thermomicrobiales bacterium]|uniref:Major facilitator superfamily (MFS) profile domain-containing protein n=1 Tax=uncultured Thermomicrobiales bacterium TaxID=1645740 RepID=A0A6J4UQ94_9BACT|nr:MAG: hypothetical protein AVDCRST_MAG59-2224 [uncultured Thermomicrobiales bacterium]